MKRPVDWFRVGVILLTSAIIVWLLILVGKSPIGLALGQERVVLPPSLEALDRVTYVMPLSTGHPLCWTDGNAESPRAIRFYRYRVEGGPKEPYLTLDRTLWVAGAPTNFCTAGTHKVPKAGHWVYEAEICWLPIAADGGNCSVRVSAACPANSAEGCAGAVGDTPRGWWVYAYLAAPSGPVVD